MELVRQVGNWSLLNKVNESGNVVYWIDNGIDDVSEYMGEFDCFEFVNKCLDYFS